MTTSATTAQTRSSENPMSNMGSWARGTRRARKPRDRPSGLLLVLDLAFDRRSGSGDLAGGGAVRPSPSPHPGVPRPPPRPAAPRCPAAVLLGAEPAHEHAPHTAPAAQNAAQDSIIH